MEIKILFFGIAMDIAKCTSKIYFFDEQITVEKLKEFLVAENSAFNNINDFAIAVNEEYAEDDIRLKQDDIVAIIPPVSGG